jgi:hypothetical protein
MKFLAQIYWYDTGKTFHNQEDVETWLVKRLPNTKVYGVLWTSDANIPATEVRVHAVVSGELETTDVLKDLEKNCQIKSSGSKVTHYAKIEIIGPEKVAGVVKEINNKPTRGNPKVFGQSFM